MSFSQLPEEFVPPDYNGGTIANVPATVAALLGVPFEGLPPLRESLWRPLAGEARRVVLVVLDALGWNLFQKERERLAPWLEGAAVVDQITSVFPSTTVNALTCLWTGLAPAQHGLVALRMFFPEYGVLAWMLDLSPNFIKVPDALVEAGLEPEQFLYGPGFAEQLAAAGIPTHAFKGESILDSTLSQMHSRGVAAKHGVVTAAEMFVQIRTLLEASPGQPLFVNAYWPSIDSLSHKYGWPHPAVAAELRALFASLHADLIAPLSREARRDTVLLIVADHGQVVTPPSQHIYLEDHPGLVDHLFMRPAGEPRVAYLYARHGRTEPLLHYFNEQLPGAAVAGTSAEALAAGLLGPAPYGPAVEERLGDVIVAMRGGHVLLGPEEREYAPKLQARHAGLTADEMEVPWLGYRLNN